MVCMKCRGGCGLCCGFVGGGEKVLKRLKLVVEEFVYVILEGEVFGGCEGCGVLVSFCLGGRKSCKELRKEKWYLWKVCWL